MVKDYHPNMLIHYYKKTARHYGKGSIDMSWSKGVWTIIRQGNITKVKADGDKITKEVEEALKEL